MVNIIKDVDLFEHIKEYDVILVGTNVYCNMGQGFQRKVMVNYPYAFDDNMSTKYGDQSKLGTIIESKRENQPTFVLLFITIGYNFRPDIQNDFLDYNALEKTLKLVNVLYKGKKVATTLLGTSRFDGNGNKEKVIEIFNKSCSDIDITIYDYFQKTVNEEKIEIRKRELEVKAVDRKKYYQMVNERKQHWKKIRELNGHTGI